MTEGQYVKHLEANREALSAALALAFEKTRETDYTPTAESVVADAELFKTFLVAG